MKQKAESLKIGWPAENDTQLGPLISAAHREKVLSYFRMARELGATIVTGPTGHNLRDLRILLSSN